MLCRSRMAKRKVTDGMAKYVTRDELRDELAAREQRMIDALGKMVIEIDHNTARRMADLRVDLATSLRVDLGRDLAGQILASEERIRAEIRGIDDQYRDLPERVAQLEEHTGIKR